MLGVLLESRARPTRRTGGVGLSVAMHVAVIVAATAATVHGTPAPKKAPTLTLVRFVRVKPPQRPRHSALDGSADSPSPIELPAPRIAVIDIPNTIPNRLPDIELGSTPRVEFALDRGVTSSGVGRSHFGPDLTRDDDSDANDWLGDAVLMRIVKSAKPRYPESLRQAGVDGTVLVQFTVDTLGRVDMSSVSVLKSTHDLFTRAVREALPGFLFKPAKVNGVRVPALAQMPFEFAISSK